MSKEKNIKSELARIIGIPVKWINKYSIVTVLFIIWVAFFDQHNIFTYQKLKGNIVRMEQEKERLNDEIARALKDKEDLKNNHEKFAREHHLMHLPGEEIILIEQK
jgi:cell division protein DivIC